MDASDHIFQPLILQILCALGQEMPIEVAAQPVNDKFDTPSAYVNLQL